MTKRKADSLQDSIRVRPSSELMEIPEPYFITHLLAPERNHDCFFMLQEKMGIYSCKVGAVKQMLLAHSSYFRTTLHEDKKNEPETIPAFDLTALTVKNLLRYIYGYNNIAALSFDEANRLFYAADKFALQSLRNNVAVHLSSNLNSENICILLNNPAYSRQLSLRSSINKILQNETEKVLANPSFLTIDVDAFVKILQQDALQVPEIELWRAAVKWASQRAGSSDGQALRTQLEAPLKHLRLCTLSPMDLCREVIPTGVLSDTEVRLVTTSVGLGEKQVGLTICNETKCRRIPEQPAADDTNRQNDRTAADDTNRQNDRNKQKDTNKENELSVVTFTGFMPKSRTKVMSLAVITKEYAIELMPFEFKAKQRPNPYVQVDKDTYECSCTIQVVNELLDKVTYIGFNKEIKYGEPFLVPMQGKKGENVRLMPNSEYTVKMNFTQPIWYYTSCYNATFSNDHFELRFTKQKDGWYLSPIEKLVYKYVSI